MDKIIESYLKMKIGKTIINCPYWSNKMKDGRVIVRGFLNGKGDSESIRKELIKRLQNANLLEKNLKTEEFRKFARRERIGIDCSGLVFRLLDQLCQLGYMNCSVRDLSEVFWGGINKTNARSLTDLKTAVRIDEVEDIKPFDMIRMMKGKHVLLVTKINEREIVYIHSSKTTKISGVHLGKIKIINKSLPLKKQKWHEETKRGFNFGHKYFNPLSGDGVFRLRIFLSNG